LLQHYLGDASDNTSTYTVTKPAAAAGADGVHLSLKHCRGTL